YRRRWPPTCSPPGSRGSSRSPPVFDRRPPLGLMPTPLRATEEITVAQKARAFGAQVLDPPQPPGQYGLFQIAWQRKSLLTLGVAVGLIVGGLYYAQHAPVYQSTSQVLVVKKRPDAVTGVNTQNLLSFEDYLATHQVLIKSPVIVERAVQKRNLQ